VWTYAEAEKEDHERESECLDALIKRVNLEALPRPLRLRETRNNTARRHFHVHASTRHGLYPSTRVHMEKDSHFEAAPAREIRMRGPRIAHRVPCMRAYEGTRVACHKREKYSGDQRTSIVREFCR
jgi:hypothetical protein